MMRERERRGRRRKAGGYDDDIRDNHVRGRGDGDDDRPGTRKHNLSIPICKDFTRNRCTRSVECRYAHPPESVVVEGETVTVCYDSLRDRCGRGLQCRYFHPPPHIRISMQEAVGLEPAPPMGYQVDPVRHVYMGPPRMPPPPLVVPPPIKTMTRPSIEVCRDYVRGRCNRDADECRYAHHTPTGGDGEYVIVCQDFMRGRCEREACRYFHPPEHLRSRIKDLPVGSGSSASLGRYEPRYEPHGLDAYGPYATNMYEHQAPKRMRLNESYGDHPHKSSMGPIFGAAPGPPIYPVPQIPPLMRPPPSPPHNADQDRLPVCRDFLRSRCNRDTTCRFVHPAPLTQVVDNYVTLCRDSLRGRCKREQCRFYHPPSKKQPFMGRENGRESRSPMRNNIMSRSISLSPEANGRSL